METEQKRKEQMKSFELMRNKAELQALSKLSIEQPLTDEQQHKMVALAQEVGLIKIYDRQE